MNVEIANIILGKLTGLNWLGKYCGVVRRVVRHSPSPLDATKTIKQYFPIACSVTNDECIANNSYNDLVPDSKYKSLLYFEDLGVQVLGHEARYINCRSTLKLVCWLNGKKLGYDGCSISTPAIMSILKELSYYFSNYINEGSFTKLKISAINEDIKSDSIFSKYSYDEAITQYLMYPNDYFSMTIQTTFSIAINCIEDFTLLPESEC